MFWRKKLFCPESVPKLGDLTVPNVKHASTAKTKTLLSELTYGTFDKVGIQNVKPILAKGRCAFASTECRYPQARQGL